MAFTSGNDVNILQASDSSVVGAGAGNDKYILAANQLGAGQTITLSDTQGSNTLQLIGGLTITSSLVANNVAQLTLSNGAVVNINGANNFSYEIGGDPLTGVAGVVQNYNTFATTTLGAPSVPATGTVAGTPNTVIGAATYTLTADPSVNEGGSLTFTVKSLTAVAADTTFAYQLSGDGTNPASAADFTSPTSGTVTIPNGADSTTFSVVVAANDGAEFPEGFKVTLKNSAGAVVTTTTATINDTSTTDIIAPVATAATFNYNENATATTVLGTVVATDNVAVTGFEISSGNTAGYFAIGTDGKITLTPVGLTSTANDADDTGAAASNNFTLGVKAIDAAGNKSAEAEIKLEVKDVDDTAPTLTSTVIVGTVATLTFNETLVGSPAVADFKVLISAGGTGEVTINKAETATGGKAVTLLLAAAPAAGQTYTVSYTPVTSTLGDAAGNPVAGFAAQTLVTDTTPPTFAAGQAVSYVENTYDDVADVIGTVVATDATGVSTFQIVTGNTAGFFAIDNSGKLTLTAAGLAGAANDFETLPNNFTLGIKATDGAGNATTQNVSIAVTNNPADDSAAPLELTLTNQTDALAGGSGDDTFIGDNTSVNPADVIDGNGGKDTARFTFSVSAPYILTSREVETFKVQNAAATPTVFNAINVTELETLTNNNSTRTLTVTSVGVNPLIGVVGGDVELGGPAAETDDFKVTYQAGKNTGTAKISPEGASLDVLDLTDGFTAYEINTTGSANSTINDFMVLTDGNADGDYDDGGEQANLVNLKSITFTGDQRLTISNELEGVTTYTATNNSGGVRVVIDDGAGINVNFVGGSGNDRVDVQALNLTANDKLDGGTGTDTLRIADADMLTVANAANVKGFEILEVRATSGTETYDVDNIIANNSLTGVTISGGNAAAANTFTVNNINAGALGNIKLELTDETDHVTLTGKGFLPGGVSDVATIDFNNSSGVVGTPTDADGIDVGTLSFVNVDVLNIKSTSDGTAAAGEQNSVTSLVASDLESIVITGDQSFSLTTAATSNNLTAVNASGLTGSTAGTYGLTLNVSAATAITSLEVRGTADVDTINTNAEGIALTLFTNGGSDVVTVDEGQASSLQFTTATLGSGDMLAGNAITVNNVLVAGNIANAIAGDLTINLASGVENILKSATTNLGAAAANVALTATIDANSNVGFVDATDLDADGTADDFALRIDLNGDGAFTAASDWQVIVVNGAAALSGVTYNATTDVFTFTGINAVVGTANADAALAGTAAADVIAGNAGNDTINTANQAGADMISGGLGADTYDVGANNDNEQDLVFFDTVNDGAALGAATGNDVITDFDMDDVNLDQFVFSGNLRTAIDRNASNTLNAATSAAADASNNATAAVDEIFFLDGGANDGVAAADVTNGTISLANIATELNDEFDFTLTGAGTYILVVNELGAASDQAAVIAWTNDVGADNAVAVGELQVIGVVTTTTADGPLVAGNFLI